jgi:hypothetical protein
VIAAVLAAAIGGAIAGAIAVNTTFSLLVGNRRGFAQGILSLFVLSASSLN